MTPAKKETRLYESAHVGSDGLSLIAYGFFLGFAGREWYDILVSDAGTTTLFGWVIGAIAALVLAGNLQLSGRLRTLNLIISHREGKRTRGIQTIADIVGVAILVSIALYVRDFPEFARGFAAQQIVKGLALMIVPAATVIVIVRLTGLVVRLTRALLGARMA